LTAGGIGAPCGVGVDIDVEVGAVGDAGGIAADPQAQPGGVVAGVVVGERGLRVTLLGCAPVALETDFDLSATGLE